MDFNWLQLTSDCDCLEKSILDCNSTFAIKTLKPLLRINDFKTYWEKKGLPILPDCDELCSLKGLSINKINSGNCQEVIDLYKIMFPLSPTYKPYFAVITISNNCGQIKHTPFPDNTSHHDFYKSDLFDFNNIRFGGSVFLGDV